MKGSHKLLIAGLIAAGATSATLYFRNPFVDRIPEWTPLSQVQPRVEQEKRINSRLEDLKSGDSKARAEAARKLGFEGNFGAVPALIEALGDKDRGVRIEAAGSLGRIGDKSAVMPLIDALNTKDNVEFKEYSYRGRVSFMDEVAAALGELKDPMAAPHLINLLIDPNYSNHTIAGAIGKIDDPRSVPYLIQALKHYDKEVRGNAVYALGGLKDERIIEPLFGVLKSESDDYVRGSSARLLANFPNERVIQGLIEAAGYTSDFTKMQVIKSLGKIGDPRAIPVISQALTGDDPQLAESAASAIQEFSAKNPGEFKIALFIEAFDKYRLCSGKNTGMLWDSADDESYKAYDRLREALSPQLVEYLKSDKEEMKLRGENPNAQTEKPPDTTVLIRKLSSPDEVTRGEAAEKLGDLREPSAVPHLLELLNDRSAFVRLCAYYALGNIGDERAVPGLAMSLADPVEPVSAYASWGLVKIGRPSIPALAETLKAEEAHLELMLAQGLAEVGNRDKEFITQITTARESKVLNRAIDAIGKIGDPAAVPDLIELAYGQKGVSDVLLNAFISIGEPAVPDLIAALEDGRIEVRRSAAFLLGQIRSKEATMSLVQHLGEKDDVAMGNIIGALGEIGDSTATSALLNLIENHHPRAWQAAEALGKIGDPAAIPLLNKIIHNNANWDTASGLTYEFDSLSHCSFEALGRIGGLAIPYLIEALNAENPNVRINAVVALGISGDMRATSVLIDALEDEEKVVQGYAFEALAKIKDPRAVPALIDLLDEEGTWFNAADALGEIGDKSALPALEKMADDDKYQPSIGNAIRAIKGTQ